MIRKATQLDFAELKKLNDQAMESFNPDTGFMATPLSIEEEINAYVFIEDEKIIAFLLYSFDMKDYGKDFVLEKKYILIEKIVVHRDHRKKKIATKLYNHLFQENQLVYYAFVVKKPVENKASLSFHRKQQFKIIGIYKKQKFYVYDNYEAYLLYRKRSAGI